VEKPVKPQIAKTRANQGDSRGILVSSIRYNGYRDQKAPAIAGASIVKHQNQ
jgi:hypothetical protein